MRTQIQSLSLVLAASAFAASGCAATQSSTRTCTNSQALHFLVGSCTDAPAAKAPAPVAAAPAEPTPAPVVAKAAPRVEVQGEQIKILEKVQFQYGSAQLLDESHTLLDEVVTVLRANPKITLIRIEGHTDSKGRASSNDRLSQKRADAVRSYLVDKGIDDERLTARGYGAAKPISDNASDEGRASNRRVEFHIVKRDEVTANN